MATPYPVSVRIGASPQAFIVDAGFALSPMGLLVTMALARSNAVWLPRGLLTLLDNDRLYRSSPDKMGGQWLPGETREALLGAMTDELAAWQRAWHYGKLAARVHWIGEAHFESALVDRDDAGLLPRFEHCAAALDARFTRSKAPPVAPLDECARDAVALAAALQPDPVVLLTPASASGGAPPLCDLLGDLAIDVQRRTSAFGAGMTPLLESALVPLEAAGVRSAIVQVLAPAVLTLPDSWDDPDWSIDSGHGPDASDDVWHKAYALWQPLVALEAAA